jgi:hypothetical protein
MAIGTGPSGSTKAVFGASDDAVTDPEEGPPTPLPPFGLDTDDDPDDLVEGAEDLPDDVRDGDVAAGEPPDDTGPIPDTEVDAPVEGSPEDDAIHDEDDV